MTSVTTALFAVTVVANSPPGFAAQTPSTPRSAIMPTDRHRLSRQNDDDRHPGRSAERHVRVRSRSGMTLASGGLAQVANRRCLGARSEVGFMFPSVVHLMGTWHALRRWSKAHQCSKEDRVQVLVD